MLVINYSGPTTPCSRNYKVWALPRSLATTCGITIVFSSYGYLDVSVPHVRLSAYWRTWCIFNAPGSPIRTPADHIVCANPRSFSQLITSFFASKSLGIPHTPLLTFFCNSFSTLFSNINFLSILVFYSYSMSMYVLSNFSNLFST